MTIRELKEVYSGKYADVEVYTSDNPNQYRFNDWEIRGVEDYSDDADVIAYQLMDKEDYTRAFTIIYDWEDAYSADDKVLCIIIKSTALVEHEEDAAEYRRQAEGV